MLYVGDEKIGVPDSILAYNLTSVTPEIPKRYIMNGSETIITSLGVRALGTNTYLLAERHLYSVILGHGG